MDAARARARERLVEMDKGIEPGIEQSKRVTLTNAVAIHSSNMTKKERVPRSIATFEHEVRTYLKD